MNPLAFFGNSFALVPIVAAVLVGVFFSFNAGAVTYSVFSYLIGTVLLALSLLLRPGKNLPFCLLLSPRELEVYNRYFIAIAFPDVGHILSVMLDTLRMVGLVWAGLSFWKGSPWVGGAQVAFWFPIGLLAVRLHPTFYMATDAGQRNATVVEERALLASVCRKREEYNAAR